MVRKDKDNWLHLQQVVHYAKTGTYSDAVTAKEKSGIRKLAASFHLEGEP